MSFVITHFNVSRDEFPSCVLILENEIHQIEVSTSPLGCVVVFTDSVGYTTEWFEDGKEWINENRSVCSEPPEWDDSYWQKVAEAEELIEQLRTKVI